MDSRLKWHQTRLICICLKDIKIIYLQSEKKLNNILIK